MYWDNLGDNFGGRYQQQQRRWQKDRISYICTAITDRIYVNEDPCLIIAAIMQTVTSYFIHFAQPHKNATKRIKEQ